MRVSMYKADHWLAFGLGGGIEMLRQRVENSDIGFHYTICQILEENARLLQKLTFQAMQRGIDSYGHRDSMIGEIDNWILSGAEGAIRILARRAEEVPLELNRVRLTAMRNQLDDIIRKMDLRAG